jgi:hypothetical protein
LFSVAAKFRGPAITKLILIGGERFGLAGELQTFQSARKAQQELRCKVRLFLKRDRKRARPSRPACFAVNRSRALSAAMSHKTRLYATEVMPSAKAAAIQSHIPAIEIAFGDTFCETNHVIADCVHFRSRVAIGRRSIAFTDNSSIAGRNPWQG